MTFFRKTPLSLQRPYICITDHCQCKISINSSTYVIFDINKNSNKIGLMHWRASSIVTGSDFWSLTGSYKKLTAVDRRLREKHEK